MLPHVESPRPSLMMCTLVKMKVGGQGLARLKRFCSEVWNGYGIVSKRYCVDGGSCRLAALRKGSGHAASLLLASPTHLTPQTLPSIVAKPLLVPKS